MLNRIGHKMADGEDWFFCANHRAFAALEQITGLGLFEFLATLPNSGRKLAPWHSLAWALSVTHRDAIGALDYEKFLDTLPMGASWDELVAKLTTLISEAFGVPKK